jgi:hypothetical protein
MYTRICTVVLFLICSASQCKKDNLKTLRDNLKGNWKLEYYTGGFTGRGSKLAPGRLSITKFDKTKEWKYEHDTLISSLPYTVVLYNNQTCIRVKDDQQTVNYSIAISHDTLFMAQMDGADMFGEVYTRY